MDGLQMFISFADAYERDGLVMLSVCCTECDAVIGPVPASEVAYALTRSDYMLCTDCMVWACSRCGVIPAGRVNLSSFGGHRVCKICAEELKGLFSELIEAGRIKQELGVNAACLLFDTSNIFPKNILDKKSTGEGE